MSGPLPSRRRLFMRNVAWNTWFEVAEAGLALTAMLVLVRIIPPAEYGRFGAALGFLALLNAFNFAGFAAQALQLPDGREPDWSLHWSAGLYIQAGLMLACHGVAALCWLVPAYRSIAPLMHLAAFGLILDWPGQLRAAMLRRAMDFPRLKTLLVCSTVVKLIVTVGAGLLGAGAMAIVLGGNVVAPVPLVVDLLLVTGWRPRPGWWRWPDWSAYRPALRFGLQQSGSALLGRIRGALESIVLPAAIGFAPMGLLDRARALYTSTAGRGAQVLMETAYPLLPRYAADRAIYARQATLFCQALLLLLVPGALYVGLEGRALARLLYGERWVAADPLFWPAAVAGLGLGLFTLSGGVLLGAGRLRVCLLLDALGAAVSVPVVAVAWAGVGVAGYAWAAAAGQLAAGALGLVAASSHLLPGWARAVLVPPSLASLLAVAAVLAVEAFEDLPAPAPRLALATGLYAATVLLALRGLFPGPLSSLLTQVPGGARLTAWLRLSSAVPAAP